MMTQYPPPTRRYVATAFGLLLIASLCALCVGSGALTNGEDRVDDVLLGLRASRIALAIIVGAGLAMAGAALQALFVNPLADPYVSGMSGAAAVAHVLCVIWLPTTFAAPFAAGAAAAGVVIVLAVLAARGMPSMHVLLLGIITNAVAWGIVSVVRATVPAAASLATAQWMLGALVYPTLTQLVIAAALCLTGMGIVVRQRASLALMALGHDEARRRGIDVRRTTLGTIIAVGFVTGAAVTTSGIIGFVGLAAPHFCRRLLAGDERAVFVLCPFVGALALVCSDGVSRALAMPLGTEIPVGAVTALLGAPLIAVLLWRGRSA